MMMEESIKNIIKEFFQEINITEENKDFFRNSIITFLAERFQTRIQNDENYDLQTLIPAIKECIILLLTCSHVSIRLIQTVIQLIKLFWATFC